MKKILMMVMALATLALVGCATGHRDVASLNEYSKWPEKIHSPEDAK